MSMIAKYAHYFHINADIVNIIYALNNGLESLGYRGNVNLMLISMFICMLKSLISILSMLMPVMLLW